MFWDLGPFGHREKSQEFYLTMWNIKEYAYEPVYNKRGLWHDAILVRKEHYDVIAVYFSICTKSKSFEQWKIHVIKE